MRESVSLQTSTRLRDARLAAGLSHAQLAAQCGLSRQAVGALETGRHRPGVDAALALAEVLGSTVEALFGAADAEPLAVLDPAALVDGAPVLTARVGRRQVHAPAAAGERWPAADGRLTAGEVEPFGDRAEGGLVVVGCDPALGLLAARLPGSGSQRLVAVHGSSTAAIDALAGGRAHAALVHGRAGALPDAPPRTVRMHVARWQVGLATPQVAPGTSLAAILEQPGPVVQRERGASSQQALERALDRAGLLRPEGPVATGHLAAARGVVDGARAGVTFEPAALEAGLSFLALEEHVVELWTTPEHRAHPGFDALGTVLVSAPVRAQLAAIGGYDLAGSGALL